MERIAQRNIQSERSIDRNYLVNITETFASHYHAYNEGPLLIVNTASIDPINNENEYQQLLEQIKEIRVGRHFFNPLSVVGFS